MFDKLLHSAVSESKGFVEVTLNEDPGKTAQRSGEVI